MKANPPRATRGHEEETETPMTRLVIAAAALAAGLATFVPFALADRYEDPSAAVPAQPAAAEPLVDTVTTASISSAKARGADKRSSYDAIIARHAQQHGVPVALAHAVVRIESNYRADARGRAGEIGLMQIKHATARGMGYSGSAKGLYDPETNIRYGMKYLAEAQRLGGGDVCGTILRYNAGHGARRMNKVSSSYCAKVKQQMAAG